MGDFNTIEEICEDLRAGKCVVMQDDEDRENEVYVQTRHRHDGAGEHGQPQDRFYGID